MTIKEIVAEWKTIKSSIGNLICYIDGKTEQLKDLESAYQKGRDDAFEEAYEKGLEDAWTTVKEIGSYPDDKLEEMFCMEGYTNVLYGIVDTYYPKQAMAILERYSQTNARKFYDVFGFLPKWDCENAEGNEMGWTSLPRDWWLKEYRGTEDDGR